MQYLTNKEEEYQPVLNVVFYKKEDSYGMEEIYAESARIDGFGIAKEFRPLRKEDLKSIASIVDNTIKDVNDSEFSFSKLGFNRDVLKHSFKDNSLEVLWISNPTKRHYESTFVSGEFYYPKLLFVLRNKKLSIYIVRDKEVTLDTKLYKVYLPNIYDNNTMCFGTMDINDYLTKNINKLILNLESCFYDSEFNDFQSEYRSKTNTQHLIRNSIVNDKKISDKELVLTNKKLKDVY